MRSSELFSSVTANEAYHLSIFATVAAYAAVTALVDVTALIAHAAVTSYNSVNSFEFHEQWFSSISDFEAVDGKPFMTAAIRTCQMACNTLGCSMEQLDSCSNPLAAVDL